MEALLSLLMLVLLSVHQGCSGAPDQETKADVPPEVNRLRNEISGVKDVILSLKAAEVEQRQALRLIESQLRERQEESEQQRRRLDQLEDVLLHQPQESSLNRRLENLEEQSEAQAAQVSSLTSRMNSSDSSLEQQQQKSTAVAAELAFLQMRLRASERTAELLKRKNAVLAGRLCSTEKMVEELLQQTSDMQVSNSSSEPERLAEVRLEEPAAATRVVHSQLADLEQKVNASVQTQELFIHNQLSVIGSRLNSSQNHLDELNRNAADQGRRLRSAEERVDELQVENRGQWDQISSIESRLRENQTEALEARVKVGEEQLEELRSQRSEVQLRLGSAERQLEQLWSRADGLQVQLRGGGASLARLEATHTDVLSRLEAARVAHAALDTRLTAADAVMTKVQTESSELQVQLGAVQKQLEDLHAQQPGTLKVAFSAGLTESGSVGPFDDETTLIFSKTFSNVGGAYDPSTGVFQAPVRGLYFFSFTAVDYLKGYTGLHLYRNSQPVLFSLGLNDHGGYASLSSGLVLLLEEADLVRLQLPASYRLYDDSRNFSCFSGFLLFSL